MDTVAMTSWSVAAAAPAMAAVGSTTSSRNLVSCSFRSACPCSSFLGAEMHASAFSPVFQQGRLPIEPRRSRRRSQNMVVRSLFGLGVPELAVIAGVAAILFGPKKLPEIGKSLGRTVKSFQQAAKEFESEVKNPTPETPGTETTNVEKSATPASTPTSTSSTGSDKESA